MRFQALCPPIEMGHPGGRPRTFVLCPKGLTRQRCRAGCLPLVRPKGESPGGITKRGCRRPGGRRWRAAKARMSSPMTQAAVVVSARAKVSGWRVGGTGCRRRRPVTLA